MKFDVKRAAAALGRTLIMGLAGSPFLFYLIVYASLGGFPLYVAKVVPVVGIAALLALMVLVSDCLGKRGKRWLGLGMAALCLGCACYAGWGAYVDSIPTVDERANLLYHYQPFSEGTKAVTLDEPSTLQFDDYAARSLTLDGATALYPVYASFVQAVYPGQDFYNVRCGGTALAYERLINREVDMIFVAAPSQDQLDMAEAAGLELHLTPIGREAFVFFVNSKNPVTGLTVEQVQSIYSGQITNWKEVGGKNQSIRPFQRSENSGSQTALQQMMGDLPLLAPEKEERIADMGGIITQVADYRNYSNALGFSFRFYSTEMVANDQIRLLALNGVEPTKQTIRDGSYPIASEFYAVTAAPIGKPAPQEWNQNMATFLEWMQGEQGQEIVERVGYVSLSKDG